MRRKNIYFAVAMVVLLVMVIYLCISSVTTPQDSIGLSQMTVTQMTTVEMLPDCLRW